MEVTFIKYHGLGNDFVVVDALDSGKLMTPEQARFVCDRHFGVGADGVLTVLPDEKTPARMHLYNSDGSVAEMCGNGIRCIAKHLFDHRGFTGDDVDIATGAGILNCRVIKKEGRVGSVVVDMGKPILEAAKIPIAGADPGKKVIDRSIEGEFGRFSYTAVSMGNPHAIIFEKRTIKEATAVGPLIERHADFPNRTNVEFVDVKSEAELDVVVWERGAGITLACGTGACATVVAACITGRCKPGDDVRVNLPGGSLAIKVEPDLSNVLMTGPAVEVYSGVIELNG